MSWATIAIIPRTCIGVERTEVVSANADRAGLRVVLAEQQAEDRGFAGPLGPTMPTVSPAAIAKLQPGMRASPRRLDRRTRRPRRRCSGVRSLPVAAAPPARPASRRLASSSA